MLFMYTNQGRFSLTLILSHYISDLIILPKNASDTGIFKMNNFDEFYTLKFADDVVNIADTATELQNQID